MAISSQKENLNQAQDKAQRTFENVKDRVRDVSGDLNEKMDEFSSEGRRFLGDAQERVSEFYDISSDWVQQNRMITTIGLAAVAGLVGYFIGRSKAPTDSFEV
jgi:ElaB/YqjD/DUF883 family membrane-anchored ribosome-binding protein